MNAHQRRRKSSAHAGQRPKSMAACARFSRSAECCNGVRLCCTVPSAACLALSHLRLVAARGGLVLWADGEVEERRARRHRAHRVCAVDRARREGVAARRAAHAVERTRALAARRGPAAEEQTGLWDPCQLLARVSLRRHAAAVGTHQQPLSVARSHWRLRRWHVVYALSGQTVSLLCTG